VNNSNEVLLEPKPEKALVENIDYSTLEVFQLDDWFDFTECLNFVEKYPEIWLRSSPSLWIAENENVVQLHLQSAETRHFRFRRKKTRSARSIEEIIGASRAYAAYEAKLGTGKNAAKSKNRKIGKRIQEKSPGFILHELNSIRLTDRHNEAV
jgi:hypothetical protein